MSKSDHYISASKVQAKYGVSTSTLRRWDGDGRVGTIRTPGGFRLYKIQDLEKIFSQPETTDEREKTKICYARVSSNHQKEDLERQVSDLKQKYPDHEIIKDIGYF